ncbi:hypothetical protein B0H15DRAFT_840002 [Mycena belliarum]|uniref:Uncharacterized protein n=1 Tax=Mycena belliarum TaxID=1033014 RepID=A0AAD6U8J0_9AGAR|nr:hypothetical protein B0H15DRAFT_840002 [Mycena belliae]
MDLDPPVSNWGDSSRLAKEVIAKYVDAHEKDLSARGKLDQFPNLVDLAAERLATLSFEHNSDSLDDIPLIVLGTYIWRWNTIAYPAMCRVVSRLSSDPEFVGDLTEGCTQNIDEWILSNERWLQGSDLPQWQRGLVTLNDADSIFPNSVLSSCGRTISRPASLPGHEVLCNAREPQITIQPSVKAFKRTFERMSDGLLKNLDWNNLVVAGGIVLGTLLSVDSPDGRPHPDPRWNSSDIDIYVYGLGPGQANKKTEHIFETFRANLPARTPTLVVRNSTTITFYARYPLRRIQIVLKLVKSPKSVLLNFDLDMCAMGWDGTTLWMLPRAARALETGCSIFTMNLVHGHYLSDRRASTPARIFKYADKGYGIRILPSYISSLAGKTRPSGPRHPAGGSLDLLDIAAKAHKDTQSIMHDSASGRTGLPVTELLEFYMSRGTSFSGWYEFMHDSSIWEMGQRGEVNITASNWASNSYQDALSFYGDQHAGGVNPRYKWDAHFNIAMFQEHIDSLNRLEMSIWMQSDYHDRLLPHGIADAREPPAEVYTFQRTTYASSVDKVLSEKKDMLLQILLPCELAVYANEMVSRAQADAGLRETKLLMPMLRQFNLVAAADPQTDGLFFWRVGKELMWQQLDRRIDEVFEVLYAFRRANKHLRPDPSLQASRISKELVKRGAAGVSNEFNAFALWVGS